MTSLLARTDGTGTSRICGRRLGGFGTVSVSPNRVGRIENVDKHAVVRFPVQSGQAESTFFDTSLNHP